MQNHSLALLKYFKYFPIEFPPYKHDLWFQNVILRQPPPAAEIVSELSPGSNPLLTVIDAQVVIDRFGTPERFTRHKEPFLDDWRVG